MNTDLQLNHKSVGSNKHGKSAKDISFIDFVKITRQELTSGSNVKSKITTCYGDISWKSKAWDKTTQSI